MTILGGFNVHTIAEVKDLIRAKDAEVAVVDKNFASLNNSAWKSSPAGQAWLSDWNALKFKWGAAKGAAQLQVVKAEMTPLPDALIPAESAYAELAAAAEGVTSVPNMTMAYLAAIPGPLGTIGGIIGPKSQDGVVHPGGLQDLFNRLIVVSPSLGAQDKAITASIQPTPRTDADLEIFKAADNLEKGTKKKAVPLALIVGGAVLAGFLVLRKPAIVIKQERAFPPLENL